MRRLILGVFIVLMLPSTAVLSQSDSVTCYEDSLAASKSQKARFSSVLSCDKALNFSALDRDERLATQVNRGILFAVLGSQKRARKDYDFVINAEAENTGEAFLNRGNLSFAQGRFEEALSDYEQAAEKQTAPLHIVYFNHAMAAERLALIPLAKEKYQAALLLAPSWALAIERLAALDVVSAYK